jgi:protein-tyrosine phosphatase
MAEAFFRDLVRDHPLLRDIEVLSVGTIAYRGNLPSSDSVEIMYETFGIDMSLHRARPLEAGLRADLVLAMDRETTEEVMARGINGHAEMLGDFAGTGEEVGDPYGASRPTFEQVAHQIKRLVEGVIDRLKRDVGESPG